MAFKKTTYKADDGTEYMVRLSPDDIAAGSFPTDAPAKFLPSIRISDGRGTRGLHPRYVMAKYETQPAAATSGGGASNTAKDPSPAGGSAFPTYKKLIIATKDAFDGLKSSLKITYAGKDWVVIDFQPEVIKM
jgi:hypothetical protein